MKRPQSLSVPPLVAAAVLGGLLSAPEPLTAGSLAAGVIDTPTGRYLTTPGSLRAQQAARQRDDDGLLGGAARVMLPALPEPERGGFRLSDVSLDNPLAVDPEALRVVLEPWLSEQVSFVDLQLAALAVSQFLVDAGNPDVRVEVVHSRFFSLRPLRLRITGLAPLELDVEPRIMVAGFRVAGVSGVSLADMNAVLMPFAGRELSLRELEAAAEALADLLHSRGYVLAQAYLPPQTVEDDIILIQVDQGVVDPGSGIDGLTITQAPERVREEVLRRFLARGIEVGEPLNTRSLERALRVAGELPGVREIRADLAPGEADGSTQVLVEVEPDNPLALTLSSDNFGSVLTGRDRLGVGLALNSPAGFGEQVYVDSSFADNSQRLQLGFDLPVGGSGLRAGLSHAGSRADIDISAVDPRLLDTPDLTSRSDITSAFLSYPLIRTSAQVMDLALSHDLRRFRRDAEGFVGLESRQRIDATTLSLSGSGTDRLLGSTWWGLSATRGQLDLSESPFNEEIDALTLQTAGWYTRVNYSLGRQQAIPALPGNGWSVLASLNGQWADGNLDSVEKFQLGGPFGVRAWPIGEGSGDHGQIVTLELRKYLGAVAGSRWTASAFYDRGRIRQFDTPFPGQFEDPADNTYYLEGYGVGLSASFGERLNARFLMARQRGENPNADAEGRDVDGRDDETRIWVIGSMTF